MLFDDLTESAKKNAVQAFSDYFDDEVSQRMLESIGNLETTRFIDVDVSKDADGAFSLDAEKRKTPCFVDGNDVPQKPERLKQTDDTVDQLFCEEYNKAVRSLASSWNDIQGAMKRHPDALAALKADDRFMTAWEKDMSDYGGALDAATDDDAEFARLGKEFKVMNSDVEDAVDDFADDDLKATQDALDRVAEVLSEESERYRTQDGVSKLSQEMGVDFDEDGEPTNLFEKTSSKSGDVEYALTRRIPAPVEMQEDTGVCPLCHSDAFDGGYCPVCGFHSDRSDDGEESVGMVGTLAYMLKSGRRHKSEVNSAAIETCDEIADNHDRYLHFLKEGRHMNRKSPRNVRRIAPAARRKASMTHRAVDFSDNDRYVSGLIEDAAQRVADEGTYDDYDSYVDAVYEAIDDACTYYDDIYAFSRYYGKPDTQEIAYAFSDDLFSDIEEAASQMLDGEPYKGASRRRANRGAKASRRNASRRVTSGWHSRKVIEDVARAMIAIDGFDPDYYSEREMNDVETRVYYELEEIEGIWSDDPDEARERADMLLEHIAGPWGDGEFADVASELKREEFGYIYNSVARRRNRAVANRGRRAARRR